MTETFSEAMHRIVREANARLGHDECGSPVSIADELQVHKATAYVQVSCCAMTDATGENHCTLDRRRRLP